MHLSEPMLLTSSAETACIPYQSRASQTSRAKDTRVNSRALRVHARNTEEASEGPFARWQLRGTLKYFRMRINRLVEHPLELTPAINVRSYSTRWNISNQRSLRVILSEAGLCVRDLMIDVIYIGPSGERYLSRLQWTEKAKFWSWAMMNSGNLKKFVKEFETVFFFYIISIVGLFNIIGFWGVNVSVII